MEKRSRLVQGHGKEGVDIGLEFPYDRHKEVISSCEDVPKTSPSFQFPINRVGITEKTLWIRLPEGLIPFEAEIYVNLPARFRGIHMSRMEQAISDIMNDHFSDIGEYAGCLAEKVQASQDGSFAQICLRGRLPLVSRTLVSKRRSVDNIEVLARAEIAATDHDLARTFTVGVGVTHITACPCTQVYNERLFQEKSNCPYPTHSQRCITWLKVKTRTRSVETGHLYGCLSSALHLSQDLLKRPDEAELVIKCHKEPQFAEDVVRMVARETAKQLGQTISKDSLIKVETTSYESIHRHNVACVLETTLDQLEQAN